MSPAPPVRPCGSMSGRGYGQRRRQWRDGDNSPPPCRSQHQSIIAIGRFLGSSVGNAAGGLPPPAFAVIIDAALSVRSPARTRCTFNICCFSFCDGAALHHACFAMRAPNTLSPLCLPPLAHISKSGTRLAIATLFGVLKQRSENPPSPAKRHVFEDVRFASSRTATICPSGPYLFGNFPRR